MQKNKFFVMGMLAMMLIFGMTVVGCDNDSPSNGNNRQITITITDIPNSITGSVQVGVGNVMFRYNAETDAYYYAGTNSDTTIVKQTTIENGQISVTIDYKYLEASRSDPLFAYFDLIGVADGGYRSKILYREIKDITLSFSDFFQHDASLYWSY
jgi:hypothetical protein